MLALERDVADVLASNADPGTLAPRVRVLADELPPGSLQDEGRGIATALGTPALSDYRRQTALYATAAWFRKLHRGCLFALSETVDDVPYAEFLRAALHEDNKLAQGVTLLVRAIGKRARLPDDAVDRAAARALDEELAYVSDVDGQPYAVQLEQEDVRQTLAILGRAATASASASIVGANSPAVDIGILTIREDEFRAALRAFPEEHKLFRGRRHYNLRTTDAGSGQTYRIAILRQIEQGNGEAQDAARDMLEELRPRLLLIVGIAGGLPSDDFTLGDVVVSTRVNDYSVESRKEGEMPSYSISGGPIATAIAAGVANLPAMEDELGDWTMDLPARPPVDVEGAQISGPEPWQKEVREKLEYHFGGGRSRHPLATAGILASSDRLVKDPSVLFPWIHTARHICAVEMESAGVYRAARDRALMVAIRGISDIVGLRRDDRWTKYACASAAAFARAYLRTTPIDPSQTAARRGPVSEPGDSCWHTSAAPEATGQNTERALLPTVARLTSKQGTLVPPLVWQLRAAPATRLDCTKTELHHALSAAATMCNWPRALLLPEASKTMLDDGTLLRTFQYRSAANYVGDEQFTLAPDGTVAFQRDTVWECADLSVDFGQLASDTLQFLRLAVDSAARLGVAGELAVTLFLRTPQTKGGTIATFGNMGVASEHFDGLARLAKTFVEGSLRMNPAAVRDVDEIAAVCKRLLDRIANDFAVEPSALGLNNPGFLSISADSLIKVAKQILSAGRVQHQD